MTTQTIPASHVITSIYRQDGTLVTTSSGPARSMSLWRSRWVKSGHIARQIDGKGKVTEYGL